MSDEQRLELERLREECLRLHHGEVEAMAVVLSQEGHIERLQQEIARLRAALDLTQSELSRKWVSVARLRAFARRIKAEAPTRLTVGEWTPIQLSQMADAALRGEGET